RAFLELVCGRRPSASREARFYARKRPGVGNFSEQNWGISVSAVIKVIFLLAGERVVPASAHVLADFEASAAGLLATLVE
ncbi:hypothetical protein, partial [Subtercola boreus]|uniref:hypothetical protein n=1 Tax=Subtercola boreus TaxID=120213 RepID=UPI001C0F091C